MNSSEEKRALLDAWHIVRDAMDKAHNGHPCSGFCEGWHKAESVLYYLSQQLSAGYKRGESDDLSRG